MPKGRRALLCLGMICGCGAPDEDFVAWPDLDLDVAFLVSHDPSGVNPEVRIGPFALQNGLPEGLPAAYRTSIPSQEVLTLVGFHSGRFADEFDAVDPSKLDAYGLSDGGADQECTDLEVVDDFRALAVPMGRLEPEVYVYSQDEGAFFATSVAEQSWLGERRLEIPLSDAACAKDEAARLEPFGDTFELIPDPAILPGNDPERGNLRELLPWNQDRVVAASTKLVFLFNRGMPLVNDSAHVSAPPIPSPGLSVMFGIQSIPSASAGEPDLILLGALTHAQTGALFVYRVLDDGLEFVLTATIANSRLERFDVAQDGRVVAVGQADLLLVADSYAGPYRESRQVSTGAEMNNVRATGDPTQPFIITTADATVWIGDPLSETPGAMVEERLLPSLIDRPAVLDIAIGRTDDGKLDLWAVVDPARLLHRTGPGMWTEVSHGVASAAGDCAMASTECGLQRPSRVVRLGFDPRATFSSRMYFLIPTCLALFRFDTAGLCDWPIYRDGDVLEERHDAAIRTFKPSANGVIGVGAKGGIYELRL